MTRPNIYDYLKIIAIIAMIIDHIGFFLLPEYPILRLIGRFAFPVFLILVWFSQHYKRRRDICIGAILVQIPLIITGIQNNNPWLRTLNILWSIIIARTILSIIHTKKIYLKALTISIIILPFIEQLGHIFDYGVFAILFPIRGMLLAKKKINVITMIWWVILRTIFTMYTSQRFWFSDIQITTLMVGNIIIYITVLYLAYENRTIKIKNTIDKIVLYIAQNSLYIYIIHLIILICIQLILWHFST